ncbi:unnamed protein product [Urochloa decumbens]|uniref:Pectinesterase inhibitor domain-containing protein n=1 Tax=Urochloa decumbens TaxID=240449 RepID=A0ABC9B9T4_9POAL
MASPMATTTSKAVLLLLLGALLPLATLASRSAVHGAHHGHAGHGPKHQHSPPASSSPLPSPTPTPSTSPAPAAAPPTTTAAAALVRATCNSTTFPELCVAALGADPSSATADVRGLSSIAVSAAATNASGGAATAAALANGTGPAASSNAPADAGDAQQQALLRVCAAKYGSARDALAAARESIAAQDYDFAAVHVSAAAEYPQVCKTLFRRQRPGAYPAELAAREEALRQLCSVASDIIALLANTVPAANN